MQQFEDCVKLVDNIWAKTISLGKVYVLRSSVTSNGKWKLHCFCLGKDIKQWCMKQTRSDIEKQKKSLELESQTWKMFFEQWREAFMNDDVFILQKDDEDKLMVTVWYTHSDNKQIPFAMELSLCDNKTKEPESRAFDPLAKLVFSMIEQLRTYQKGIASNAATKSEHHSTLFLSPPSSTPVTALTVGYIPPSLKKQGQLRRRRPGNSLINPRVKRIRPKPTKIGEN